MRVIAGTVGGIPLETPSTDLRPTMDKVKGAIFSSLGEKVLDAHVLDLFAGCGGLGIEALSRGAANAVLVENNRSAVEVIRRNLAKTRLQAEVVEQGVYEYLQRAPERAFDIIIADPPYVKNEREEDHAAKLLMHPRLPQLLAPDGLFVLEKAPYRALPRTPQWSALRSRGYGRTEVVYLVPAT